MILSHASHMSTTLHSSGTNSALIKRGMIDLFSSVGGPLPLDRAIRAGFYSIEAKGTMKKENKIRDRKEHLSELYKITTRDVSAGRKIRKNEKLTPTCKVV